MNLKLWVDLRIALFGNVKDKYATTSTSQMLAVNILLIFSLSDENPAFGTKQL